MKKNDRQIIRLICVGILFVAALSHTCRAASLLPLTFACYPFYRRSSDYPIFMIEFIKKRTIFTDRPYRKFIAFQMIVQYPITMGTRMKIKKQIFELNKNIYMPIRKSHTKS